MDDLVYWFTPRTETRHGRVRFVIQSLTVGINFNFKPSFGLKSWFTTEFNPEG